MRANALAFIDQFGAEPLSGVHPEHGFLRVKYACTLMVDGATVVGVGRGRIVFDHFSGYRTKAGQSWGPPIYELADGS